MLLVDRYDSFLFDIDGVLMRGEDAVRRYYQDWIDTVDHLQAEVVEVIAEAGEQVVVVVRNSGHGRVSAGAAA